MYFSGMFLDFSFEYMQDNTVNADFGWAISDFGLVDTDLYTILL
jgi:hypothetical protein